MEKLRTWVGSAIMAFGVWIMPSDLRSFYIMVFDGIKKGLKERNEQLAEINREYYRGNN